MRVLSNDRNVPGPKPYLVLRMPCVPEDEGRGQWCDRFANIEDAREWIRREAAPGEYFKAGDYAIFQAAE